MTQGRNFSNQATPTVVDTEYRDCNFAQSAPVWNESVQAWRGVRLFPGDDTPRTFIDCNLTNCEPPPGSTFRSCTIVRRDVLTSSEVITIDGVDFASNSYSHIVVGRYLSDGTYDDLATPLEYEARVDEE